MIKCRRGPPVGAVAGFADCGKSGGLVIRACSVIVIVLMAGETFRRRSGIAASVTIDTIQESMRAGYGKLCLAVIECSCIPAIGGMAFGAIMAEIIGDVIGIVSSDIIFLVTRPAVRRRSGITVGMTFDTIQRGMRPRERELGLRMVERRWCPSGGGMALRAILAEIVRHVIGIADAVIVILVTGPAIRWRSGELPVYMTAGTVDRQMLAGQWETGKVMIERGRAPPVLVVALGAILRKAGGDMIWIGNRVIVIPMASYTISRQVELVVNMAIDAA